MPVICVNCVKNWLVITMYNNKAYLLERSVNDNIIMINLESAAILHVLWNIMYLMLDTYFRILANTKNYTEIPKVDK